MALKTVSRWVLGRALVVIVFSGLALAQASPAEVKPDSTLKPVQAQDPALENPVDPNSLLPEPTPLPRGKATVIGGKITSLDRVRDHVVVQPFGGKDMKVSFDGRTQIFRDGKRSSALELRPGDRVYLDTVLDGTAIFAKSIRVVTNISLGESRGQIVEFSSGRNELTFQDSLSNKPIKVQLLPGTKIVKDGQPLDRTGLRPGSLVTMQFRPDGEGRVLADQLTVLAEPGAAFTFVGRVIHLDLHSGLLVVMDPRDKKNYEISFDPSRVRVNGELQTDAEVTVTASFDGSRYSTAAILVNSTPDK